MKKSLLVVSLFGVLINGCAGRLVVMKDQNGNVQKCEVSAGQQMAIGLLANAQVKNCIKTWESAGYKRVN